MPDISIPPVCIKIQLLLYAQTVFCYLEQLVHVFRSICRDLADVESYTVFLEFLEARDILGVKGKNLVDRDLALAVRHGADIQ